MTATYTDVHNSPNPSPAEGERCGQCDRAFELGDMIATVVVAPPTEGLPPKFRHYHEGCALFLDPGSMPPAVSRNAGFYRPADASEATAA